MDKQRKSTSKVSLSAQIIDTITRHHATNCPAVLQISETVELLSIAANGTMIPMIDNTQAVLQNPSYNGESDKELLVRLISAVKMLITIDNHTVKRITINPDVTPMSANRQKKDCKSPKCEWSSEEFF